jgi:hypothetical protein
MQVTSPFAIYPRPRRAFLSFNVNKKMKNKKKIPKSDVLDYIYKSRVSCLTVSVSFTLSYIKNRRAFFFFVPCNAYISYMEKKTKNEDTGKKAKKHDSKNDPVEMAGRIIGALLYADIDVIFSVLSCRFVIKGLSLLSWRV